VSEKESLKKLFIKGVSNSFLVKVTGTILKFVLQVVIARIAGADVYGRYSYTWSWLLIGSTLSTIGFRNYNIKKAAEIFEKKEIGKLNSLRFYSGIIVTLVAVIVACLAYIAVYIGVNLGPGAFTIGIPIIVLVSICLNYEGFIRGIGEVVKSEIPLHILRPASLIIFLLLTYVLKLVVNINIVIFGVYISIILSIVLCYRWSSVHQGFNIKQNKDIYKWMKEAVPYLLISGVGIIQSRVDVIMVGFFKSATDVGLYQAAYRVVKVLGFGLAAANMFASPKFSQLYVSKEYDDLEKIVHFTTAVGAIFATFAAVVLLFGGESLLGVFGKEFSGSYYCLLTLTLGQLVFAYSGPVGMLTSMTGGEWVTTYALSAGAVSNVVLNYFLIPLLGIEGAAVASAVSSIVWSIILIKYTRLNLKIEPSIIGTVKKLTYE